MTGDVPGPSEEAPPASPAEALRFIEAERAAAWRSMSPNPLLTYVPWGTAWLVGFGLLFLRFGPNERVLVPMPSWLPLTVLYVLLIAAFIVSGWAGARAGRHVTGDSSVRGLQYGLSWFAGFAVVAVVANRFSDGLPPAERALLWGALSVAVVGVLYMAGAAIWQSSEMFLLGGWITLADIAGVLAGPGWHSLVICLAGGGGLLVGGLAAWLRWCARGPAPWILPKVQ
jgi:hypothetical protein